MIKGVLRRNFTKFIGKQLCQSLFFNKVAGLQNLFFDKVAGLGPATLLKERPWSVTLLKKRLWRSATLLKK